MSSLINENESEFKFKWHTFIVTWYVIGQLVSNKMESLMNWYVRKLSPLPQYGSIVTTEQLLSVKNGSTDQKFDNFLNHSSNNPKCANTCFLSPYEKLIRWIILSFDQFQSGLCSAHFTKLGISNISICSLSISDKC